MLHFVAEKTFIAACKLLKSCSLHPLGFQNPLRAITNFWVNRSFEQIRDAENHLYWVHNVAIYTAALQIFQHASTCREKLRDSMHCSLCHCAYVCWGHYGIFTQKNWNVSPRRLKEPVLMKPSATGAVKNTPKGGGSSSARSVHILKLKRITKAQYKPIFLVNYIYSYISAHTTSR